MRTMLLLAFAGLAPALIAANAPARSDAALLGCAKAEKCSVRGIASAWSDDEARIELADQPGRCVSVYLPPEKIARLRAKGPKVMSIKGRLYGGGGERTPFSCGGAFLFVAR